VVAYNDIIIVIPYVCAERHDAVFVVGSLDEAIMLRGMRYHPTDIENTVVRCHQKICEWLALSVLVVAKHNLKRMRTHSQCKRLHST